MGLVTTRTDPAQIEKPPLSFPNFLCDSIAFESSCQVPEQFPRPGTPSGDIDGIKEGLSEGTTEGVSEGTNDGLSEGTADRDPVGAGAGAFERLCFRDSDGRLDGEAELDGTKDGESDTTCACGIRLVGLLLGATVGANEGACDGNEQTNGWHVCRHASRDELLPLHAARSGCVKAPLHPFIVSPIAVLFSVHIFSIVSVA